VAHLRRVRDYLTRHAYELANVISKDNGKTRIDALATEVLPAVMAVDYYCRKARSFLRNRRLMPSNWLMANKSSKIIRVPFGVVGIISPWNYPFSIPFSEVVMALLAGNSVLLKVATETQQVGRALERSMTAAGLPLGVFTYLNLPGRVAGNTFLEAGAEIYAQSSNMPKKGNFLPAMVLTRVDHSMDIMRLETFGPVLGVMPVDDMGQAVALANDSDLGLTASVWTSNPSTGNKLARRLKAGAVTINDHLMSHGLAETPWGGFKKSGIGRTHGAIGMAEMTQPQCVVHDYLSKVKKNFWWHPHGPAIYNGLRGLLYFLYVDGIWPRLKGLAELLRLYPRTFFEK
jgi:acyl-CoA reductase-like NAD-dependent aldehyde dehydrogenase